MTTATVERHIHAGVPSPARPVRPKKVWIPFAVGAFATIALMVAVASFVINANTTASDSSQLRSQIGALQQQLGVTNMQLNTLRTELRVLKVSTSTGQLQRSVAGLRNSVTGLQGSMGAFQRLVIQLQGSVKMLTMCVPELQQELGGLSINQGQKGSSGGVSLSNQANISSDCTSILYGSPSSGH
jgi:hypothetical protein